ncbi:MAG: hypothetical protein ACMUJM_25880 [bacterium]
MRYVHEIPAILIMANKTINHNDILCCQSALCVKQLFGSPCGVGIRQPIPAESIQVKQSSNQGHGL